MVCMEDEKKPREFGRMLFMPLYVGSPSCFSESNETYAESGPKFISVSVTYCSPFFPNK